VSEQTPSLSGLSLDGAVARWFNDLSTQGIFTTDTTLVVRSWNRALEEHTGVEAALVLGRPLFEVIPELVTRGLDSHYRAALSGEARVLAHRFHQYLIPGRSGAPPPSQTARIAPLQADGTIVGTITVVEDVGERVASERELRSQIEAALTSRASAENALRVKDEFLATLSHEIRTPLNAVLGWTKILLGRPFDQAMAIRALQVIDRNAVAQTRLIDDMLDMARIMSGKLRLDMQPVDLGIIALSAMDVVATTATAKGITVATEIETNEPWMMGDPDRLQQIVWNLLSNAVKFTDSGGHVSLRLARRDAMLELCVEDTGRGISPDFLPQMFERFRQADASSSRRNGGLGLGLSLVRQLVELHGGQVKALSEVGVGSQFFISFPGRTELSMADADPDLQASLDVPLDGVRVLLVEDQQDAREILSAALQQRGVIVTAVESSPAALAALDAAITAGAMPDVIISDIGLPEEDGYRLIELIGQRPPSRGGRIPVIALTAYGRPQDKRRALAAGFRLHLTKPITPDALAAAVASVLPPSGER
jgi:hypothetical protein